MPPTSPGASSASSVFAGASSASSAFVCAQRCVVCVVWVVCVQRCVVCVGGVAVGVGTAPMSLILNPVAGAGPISVIA